MSLHENSNLSEDTQSNITVLKEEIEYYKQKCEFSSHILIDMGKFLEQVADGNLGFRLEETCSVEGWVAANFNSLVNVLTEAIEKLPPDDPLRAKFNLVSEPEINSWSRSTIYPILQSGDTGYHVSRLQELLKAKRHYGGIIDGEFGFRTKASVMRFQKSNGLLNDGIVNDETWKKLDKNQS